MEAEHILKEYTDSGAQKLIEEVILPCMMDYFERYQAFIPSERRGNINVMRDWMSLAFDGLGEPVPGALLYREYMKSHPSLGSYIYGSAVRNPINRVNDIDIHVFDHRGMKYLPAGCDDEIRSIFKMPVDIHLSSKNKVCRLRKHLNLLENMILEAVPIPWNAPLVWNSKILVLHRMETLSRSELVRFIDEFTFDLSLIRSQPCPIRLAMMTRNVRDCLAAAVMSVLRIYPNPTDAVYFCDTIDLFSGIEHCRERFVRSMAKVRSLRQKYGDDFSDIDDPEIAELIAGDEYILEIERRAREIVAEME